MAIAGSDPHEILGSNTRAEMVDIDRHMRMAKCRQLMADGVTIFYPETCVIDSDVEIGRHGHRAVRADSEAKRASAAIAASALTP